MKTTIETDENGDMVLNIPPELIASGLFLEGDDVSFTAEPGCIRVENLSCKEMPVSRFKRNLNGILKKINNDSHPLNRVFVKRKTSSFWIIPYDKNKQRAYFLENKNQEEIRNE